MDLGDEYFTVYTKPKLLQGGNCVFEIRQAEKSNIPDLVGLDDECFDVYYYKKPSSPSQILRLIFEVVNPFYL